MNFVDLQKSQLCLMTLENHFPDIQHLHLKTVCYLGSRHLYLQLVRLK